MRPVWCAPISLLLGGCFLFESNPVGVTEPKGPSLHGSTIEGVQLDAARWNQALATVLPESASEAELWAVSHCNCAPAFMDRYGRNLVMSHGVLPELLVPNVREEIRANDKLKLLTTLKEEFASVARKLFLDDGTILSEIRTAIAEKIHTASGWGQNLAREKIRFSPFPPVGSFTAISSDWSQFFSVPNQAIRWNFIFSQEGMWTGVSPMIRSDHAYQFLNVMLALSEWQYMFGLSHTQTGAPYGGLTLATDNPTGSGLMEFDPRKDYSVSRFITGRYALSYKPGYDAIDTAFNARETWTNIYDGLSLDEQAKVWSSAARILHRTRPRNRNFTSNLFDPVRGVLPDETHFLGLIVLPSFQDLLGKRFINEETRKVRTFFPPGSAGDMEEVLDSRRLMALTRALEAMNLWYQELQNVNDIKLSKDLTDQLTSSGSTIKRGMQFITQVILGEFGETTEDGSNEMQLVVANGTPSLTAAEAAEVLTTLANAERTVLASTFLHMKLGRLSDWYVKEYLQRANVDKNVQLGAADLMWTHTLFTALEGETTRDFALPWLQPTAAALRTMIQNWDKQL
jgi:hypothetical protein